MERLTVRVTSILAATVMFSTGPMFLSFQYNLWPHRAPSANSVRILPKIFYGKNAKEEEAKESFFWHYYGSSWHDGDAGFVTFVSCPALRNQFERGRDF